MVSLSFQAQKVKTLKIEMTLKAVMMKILKEIQKIMNF